MLIKMAFYLICLHHSYFKFFWQKNFCVSLFLLQSLETYWVWNEKAEMVRQVSFFKIQPVCPFSGRLGK